MNYIFKIRVNDDIEKMGILIQNCRNPDDYDSLSRELQDKIDNAWYWFADNLSELTLAITPLHETSMVYWLPINGTIPPTDGIAYLVTDGETTCNGFWSDGHWIGMLSPTHYVEYPVIGK